MPPDITNTVAPPMEPELGTVLAYSVELGGKTYHYASNRAGDGRWYTTGGSAIQGVDWTTLADALRTNAAAVCVATGWAVWSL
jgi:hypothetical protein